MTEVEKATPQAPATRAGENVEVPDGTPDGSDGTDFVDSFGSPEGNARFRRVYGHMKEYERVISQLMDHNNKLQAAVDDINSNMQTQTQVAALNAAKKSLKEAKDIGNTDAEVEAHTRIAALSIPKKKVETKAPEIEVPNLDVTLIRTWANELQDGNFVRPWTQPGHPKYYDLLDLTKEVSAKFPDDVEAVLRELDARMGIGSAANGSVTPQRRSPVLSGGAGRRAQEKVSLTPEQKEVARQMGIKEEAYLKQLRLIAGPRTGA